MGRNRGPCQGQDLALSRAAQGLRMERLEHWPEEGSCRASLALSRVARAPVSTGSAGAPGLSCMEEPL